LLPQITPTPPAPPSSNQPAPVSAPPAPPAAPGPSPGVVADFSGSAPAGGLAAAPSDPAGPAGEGPLAGLLAAQQSALAAAAQQAARLGATPADGGANTPQAPEPGSAGGSPFAAGGSGVAFGLLLALLFSIAAFALQQYTRLRLPPGQWRSFAFIAVVERPG
jgi:hypothetical protein